MSRAVSNYTVTTDGRDKGKVFVLTEMSASRGEAWATRAILALMDGGIEVPSGFEQMGMAGMAEIGFKALAGLKYEIAEPLLAEMFSCVQIIPDPSRPQLIRNLIEEDIEEIMTRVLLRVEVFKLHADFFKAVAPSISGESQTAARKRSRNT